MRRYAVYMHRTPLLVLLALVLVAGGAWYWFSVRVPVEPAPGSPSPAGDVVEPRLAIDLYPLYTGASWNKAVAESTTIGTTTYTGAGMTSATIDAGMDPGSVFMPFLNYYDQLLNSHGWHAANDLAAGGHTGGVTGYKNGPGTILVSYQIDYQSRPANAPSECPCTVTLSLFSNVTN